MTKENSCAQIKQITRVLSIACLSSMLLCYKLWLPARNFPLSPVFEFPLINNFISYSIAIITLISLSCIIFLRNPQKVIIVFVVASFLLALMDLNRWQPWFYQYVLMFFILAFFNFRCDGIRSQQAIVNTFKLMIAAIYFWSGLQKLNPHFLTDTFPWLMEPISSNLGMESEIKFKFLGYAFPLIETGTGTCLLIPALQKPAVIAATVMHCFILFILSPFGHNYNPVVWPWNIAMIIFVYLLFFYESSNGIENIKSAFNYNSSRLILSLFVLFPLFNFFNRWDSYLSHNLYSGNTSNGVIYISDNIKNRLPDHIKKYASGEGEQSQINIKYWCMQELGVPAYPEKRNFDAVTNTLYAYSSDSSEIYLLFTPKLKVNSK